MKIWRPYTQMQTAQEPLRVQSAKGAYLATADGRQIFDGISSWWLTTHGHAEPRIVEAISKQAEKLEQVVFANFDHEPAEEMISLLSEFLPKEFSHAFFSDNGSTAVEVAMKMAYQSCAQNGLPLKKKFVAFASAYHGDTCGAMSVSGESSFTKPYGTMRFEVLRAQQGQLLSDPTENWTADFERILTAHGHEICAVLIEPLIQGAGGMIMWPPAAVEKICALAHAHNVLIIFDEVMTGFGRTGSLFACQQLAAQPDFLCFSKGITAGFLPMGLTVTTSAIYDAFLDTNPNKMLFHGHSFTGNALSCAAAVANLQIFKNEDVLDKIAQIATAHRTALQSLAKILPSVETRVCGNIGVLQLDVRESYGSTLSRTLYKHCLQNNLFIRPLGSTLYLMPPYCSTPAQITAAWTTLGEVVEASLNAL